MATPSPNPHLSMSINGGATVSAGWAATQPRRRRTVDHSSRSCLLRPSYGSTRGFGTRRIAVRSASQKNSSPPLMTTEQEAEDEVVLESPAHFRIYKSGKIDRLNRPPVLPAGLDEATGVTSKDVVLDADTGVSVRLFLPKLQEPSKKLPVVVFFHGGAFFIESAGSETYHNYVNSLAAAAGVLVVSVDYRLAPEHPLPAGYDDSWAALQWAASAQDGWIAEHGDTARLFVAGDSAGANIAHEMLVRAAASGGGPRGGGAAAPVEIEGEPEGGAAITAAMWNYACPGAAAGADDPRLNPLAAGGPVLEELACERMLVCAGGKDVLAARNRAYYDAVAASAWRGSAAWLESEGEGHVFFLGNSECENAKQLMDRIVAFIADKIQGRKRTCGRRSPSQTYLIISPFAIEPAGGQNAFCGSIHQFAMASETEPDAVVFEAPAHFRIYKSGKMDRLHRPPCLPAGVDEATGVASKDVVIDAGTGLSVRLYLPKIQEPSKKLPVLVFFHGGGFLIESADSSTYHNYVNPLAAAAGVVVVSVDYRLAPEHPLPAAYDDSWAGLLWAASAQDGWLAEHGDVSRLFIAGDSAGGNIVHDMLLRAASNGGPRIEGALLLHPWFGGSTVLEGEPPAAAALTGMIWCYACPGASGGADDPRMNPLAPGAPALEKLACERMLVAAGQTDGLAARDRAYYDAVAASPWRGTATWVESEGEGHVFFLEKPECDKAKQLMDRVVEFISAGSPA
uniref:Alpha/beta hydrolase fold-3 domain-containing protein n=2 Tax=Oryza TaxID=4527 RepID=A0A0E0QSE9_ORYRU